jgi:hypothetical protein
MCEANDGGIPNREKSGPLCTMLDADQYKQLFVFSLNGGLEILVLLGVC